MASLQLAGFRRGSLHLRLESARSVSLRHFFSVRSTHTASPGPSVALTRTTAWAALARSEKAELMRGVSPQHSLVVARVLDQVSSCLGSSVLIHSDFLTPPCQEEVLRTLRRIPHVSALLSGGYEEAERCRVSFGSDDATEAARNQLASQSISASGADPSTSREGAGAGEETQDVDAFDPAHRTGVPGAVAVCRVVGPFSRGPARKVSHGDFLGAVLGTGIAREKVGDVLLMEELEDSGLVRGASANPQVTGAYVILVPELETYLKTTLSQVHHTNVEVSSVPAGEIQVRPQRVSTLRTVEASLRLDAVGSAGFRLSRSKFADLINAGKVRLNWKEDVKAGHQVGTGDVISVRGFGRCKIGDIEVTKKGRMSVEITRYS